MGRSKDPDGGNGKADEWNEFNSGGNAAASQGQPKLGSLENN